MLCNAEPVLFYEFLKVLAKYTQCYIKMCLNTESVLLYIVLIININDKKEIQGMVLYSIFEYTICVLFALLTGLVSPCK